MDKITEFKDLAGHVYAPGYAPTFWERTQAYLASQDYNMAALVILLVALALIFAYWLRGVPLRRDHNRDLVREQAQRVRAAEREAEVRKLRRQRMGIARDPAAQ